MLKHCALPDQGLRWLGYGRLADWPFAGLITATLPGHASWGVVSESIPVNAAIAGWRRSLSRQRPRFGPMLPTGMPSLALISAYGTGGSSRSRAISCWQQGGSVRERLAQRRVPLGREQLLLRRYGLLVRDGLGVRRMPSVVRSPRRAQDTAAFAPGGGGQPAGKRGRIAQCAQLVH